MVRSWSLKVVAAVGCAAFLLAACSSAGSPGGSAGSRGGSGAAGSGRDATGGGGAAQGGAKPSGDATTGSTSPGAAGGAGRPTYPEPSPPPGSLDNLYDFVRVDSPQTESWGGKNCFPPRPGSDCTVLMQGSAYLATDTKGSLVFLAHENGAALGRTVLTKPAQRWRNTVYEWVPYKVPPKTWTVTFYVELRNSAGVMVARSDPMTFPVTTD